MQGDTIEIGIFNRSTSIGPSIATSAPTPTQGAMIWKDMWKKHHVNKRAQTSQISISPPPATQTIRDQDIPPDFFSLLEELENTLSTQSVVPNTVTQDNIISHNLDTPTEHHTHTDIPNSVVSNTVTQDNTMSHNLDTPTVYHTHTDIPNSINPRANLNTQATVSLTKTTQNISTQTRSARNIRWAPKTEHKHTNTQFVKSVDKSTNTDPLIILDPVDIRSLHRGLHIATYNPEHQIYLTTNNSLSIMPVPKPTSNQQPINQHTTVTCSKSSTQTEGQLSQIKVDHQTKQDINDPPKNPHQPLQPHTSGNKMTTNTTNKTSTQYQPEQLKVKKRVQWDSKTISHLLQIELKHKCDVTIKRLPYKTKTKPKVQTHKRLTSLANRYFPYEREQHRTKPTHAHTTTHTKTTGENQCTTDWSQLVHQEYSPTKPDIIDFSSSAEDNSSESTPETPIILDESFQKGLTNLFGEVSSSDED